MNDGVALNDVARSVPCEGELHMWALSRAVFRERVRALAEPDPDPHPDLSLLNTYI